MAFLVEQAGGLGVTGKNRIMDLRPKVGTTPPPHQTHTPAPGRSRTPPPPTLAACFPLVVLTVPLPAAAAGWSCVVIHQSVHQRVPCILGSEDDVREMKAFYDASTDPQLIRRCLERLG